MATLLTPRNVRSHLEDLPGEADVVAIDALRRKVRHERYHVYAHSPRGV
jgi:hypothetical protein